MENKSKDKLDDFVSYCIDHPDERFWQALRNWAEVGFVWTGEDLEGDDKRDTFYIE